MDTEGEPDKMTDKKFNFKTFTSFTLVLTFFALLVSGVMLFISPAGRVAHWTDWSLLGLTKEGWQAVHVLTALMFLIGGIFHLLKFNWKVFVHYLAAERKGASYLREAGLSVALFLVVVAGTIAGLPPLASVTDLGEEIKLFWEAQEGSPPIPHMELKTLAEVSEQLGIPIDKAQARMVAAGWNAEPDFTLQQIARNNEVSPREVYARLAPLDEKHEGGSVVTPIKGIGRIWSGIGRMTIDDLSARLGTDLVANLKAMGIEAKGHERWRRVAERSGFSPRELLEKITSQSGR